MDFSKFKTSDWLMIGGGLGMLIFGLFVGWASVDTGFASDTGLNAFDYFFTGGIAWILIVGSGTLAFLLAGGFVKKDGGPPWPLILVLAGGLGAVLMLLRLLFGAGSISVLGQSFDYDRGAGMYLSFLATAATAVGAFLNFQAEGGTLDDLKDIDKIKSQLSSIGKDDTGSTPMPPPPPGGAVPPPPPPPAP